MLPVDCPGSHRIGVTAIMLSRWRGSQIALFGDLRQRLPGLNLCAGVDGDFANFAKIIPLKTSLKLHAKAP